MSEEKPMSATAIGLTVAITLLVASGVGNVVQHHGRQQAAEQAQADRDAVLAQAAQDKADLAQCLAEQAPKTVDAVSRVVDAVNAPAAADASLRAALVSAIPQSLYAEAVIATGSPQSIAAAEQMASCHAANTTGDSGRSGCATQVPAAWAAAVAALAACPAPPSCPDPDPGLDATTSESPAGTPAPEPETP